MTFGAGYRATRSVDPCPKCAGVNPHKGRKPDCGFTEAEPRSGEAYTVCYAPFDKQIPQYVIKDIDDRLRKAVWFLQQYEDGTLKQVSGAVAGNKVAAWRTEQRTDELFEVINWDKNKTLFITVTHPYIKTEQGRKESWLYFQKELPRFIRKLKAQGMKDFIAVKEAHRDGGCHVHILSQWGRDFRIFEHKGKRRIANRKIRDFIKSNWAGDIDLEAMRDDDVKGYMKKYLGKYSHIEDSLRRAKRQWNKEGDMRHKDADCKKLWTNYYCGKLKIRRFTSSIKKRRSKKAATPPDLVNNMNNSTLANKPKLIREWKLDWHIKYNPAFEAYNGKIDPDSRAYQLMMNFIRGKEHERL